MHGHSRLYFYMMFAEMKIIFQEDKENMYHGKKNI